MSKLKPTRPAIELGGNSYELCFNLNVLESLQEAGWEMLRSRNGEKEESQEEASGWEAIAEIYRQFDRRSLKATKIILTAMLNEGIEIENEGLPEEKKIPLFTKKQLGRLITDGGAAIRSAVVQAINEATPKEDGGIVAKNKGATTD